MIIEPARLHGSRHEGLRRLVLQCPSHQTARQGEFAPRQVTWARARVVAVSAAFCNHTIHAPCVPRLTAAVTVMNSFGKATNINMRLDMA